MRFIGIDLHYDNFVAAYFVGDKIVQTVRIYFNDKVRFEAFLKDLRKGDFIALEASTNSFWFYDQICERVTECFIINTRKFLIVSGSVKKTDKIDAKKIAKKLRYRVLYSADEDEFPTVFVPNKKVQELRTLFTTYEMLSSHKTSLKNRIFSLLVGQGYYFKSKELHARKKKEKILSLAMADSVRFQLELLYDEIELKEKKIKEIKNKILELGIYFEKEIDKLVEIKGISVFTAIAIMTDIADIKRFKSSKKLCSYLRSAPKVDSSNKSTKIGSVNKQSRKLALKMLLQGLAHAYKSSPYLLSIYERKIKSKKAGKVRIAIARKIFTSIFHMLKNDKHYYWKDNYTYNNKKKEYEIFIRKLA